MVASLSLCEPADAPRSDAAVAQYEDLRPPAKLVFRFHRVHGSAMMCTEPKCFSALLGDLGDHGTDPYREANGYAPEWLYVQTGADYHRVNRLVVYDQVLQY